MIVTLSNLLMLAVAFFVSLLIGVGLAIVLFYWLDGE